MDKTEETYEFLCNYYKKNKFPPTMREICRNLDFNSTSTATYHLKKLEKMGKISRTSSKNRAIDITDFSASGVAIPVVGDVAAGQPILATENITEKIFVSDDLFSGSNLFMLKVKGLSMVNAGILDGDYVVVSKQSTANNGEIVVCLIDNDATVKRFYKEDNCFRLQPENDFMGSIYTDHLEVLGKVVGLIRNHF